MGKIKDHVLVPKETKRLVLAEPALKPLQEISFPAVSGAELAVMFDLSDGTEGQPIPLGRDEEKKLMCFYPDPDQRGAFVIVVYAEKEGKATGLGWGVVAIDDGDGSELLADAEARLASQVEMLDSFGLASKVRKPEGEILSDTIAATTRAVEEMNALSPEEEEETRVINLELLRLQRELGEKNDEIKTLCVEIEKKKDELAVLNELFLLKEEQVRTGNLELLQLQQNVDEKKNACNSLLQDIDEAKSLLNEVEKKKEELVELQKSIDEKKSELEMLDSRMESKEKTVNTNPVNPWVKWLLFPCSLIGVFLAVLLIWQKGTLPSWQESAQPPHVLLVSNIVTLADDMRLTELTAKRDSLVERIKGDFAKAELESVILKNGQGDSLVFREGEGVFIPYGFIK